MADILPPPFKPGTGVAPSSLVGISILCRKLTKSDTMVVTFVTDPVSQEWKEFERTEIIWNNANPEFVKPVVIQYYFQESQKLKFEVYHIKTKSSTDLTKQQFLGRFECTLGDVISSNKLTKRLEGPKKDNGEIIVTAEELSTCKQEATFQFCAHNLDKKDFMGKSDPYLTFSKLNKDGSYTVVHRTEPRMKTVDPTWEVFTVPVRALCNGDYDRVIRVECYDWNASRSHDYIGSFKTTLAKLNEGKCPSNVYECINEKEKADSSKKYHSSGTVELMSCSIDRGFTFLDYIRGGVRIHCTFAINLSATNGDPNEPTSLHYIGNPDKLNPYETAIKCVGDIIQEYHSEKEFIALGFGARLPPDGAVFHEFALNGKPDSPHCQGIEGVLQAYRKSLASVQLYGPPKYAPCVKHVTKFAAQAQPGKDYYILLILTDGIITDLADTTEAIVHAAKLPMSIVIIGVGGAYFDAMKILDGDDVRLKSGDETAERDIVQFVPMRDFVDRGDDSAAARARLAHKVLEEIPDQFLSYMQKHGVEPRTADRGLISDPAPSRQANNQLFPKKLPPIRK